jgi:hypothetical protein
MGMFPILPVRLQLHLTCNYQAIPQQAIIQARRVLLGPI